MTSIRPKLNSKVEAEQIFKLDIGAASLTSSNKGLTLKNHKLEEDLQNTSGHSKHWEKE